MDTSPDSKECDVRGASDKRPLLAPELKIHASLPRAGDGESLSRCIEIRPTLGQAFVAVGQRTGI
jgi:hypothetical protein